VALEIEIEGSAEPAARYLTYAAVRCRIRELGLQEARAVRLGSRQKTPNGGLLSFYSDEDNPQASEELDLVLPADESWVEFTMGGRWEFPSSRDGDCALEVREQGNLLTEIPVMVRVRKNANELSSEERARFLRALAVLNNGGNGKYQVFRDMHVDAADAEEHRGPQFLPWHRSYLLDLEREMQAVDTSVSLHYWRFDQPASTIFRSDFMGLTNRLPTAGRYVVFDAAHPFNGWITDGDVGIERVSRFDTATEAASGSPGFPVATQNQTLQYGDAYGQFLEMEGTPHGAAHVSFLGWIGSIQTAVKDPLFFMLHSNIDRLWALWQWYFRRFDSAQPDAYVPQNIDGRRVGDTMWPWNGVTSHPRPRFAPGGGLASSPILDFPGATPRVGDMVDYAGHLSYSNRLGFGYDNVPYQFE
jgi:tyrosinase